MDVLHSNECSSSMKTGWIDKETSTARKVNVGGGASNCIYSPTNTSIVTYLVSAHGIPVGSTIDSDTIGMKVPKLDPVDALTREAVRIGSTNCTNGLGA